jgi:hypothetical protein
VAVSKLLLYKIATMLNSCLDVARFLTVKQAEDSQSSLAFESILQG